MLSLVEVETVPVAVVRDRLTLHEFHDEERSSVAGTAGVEHLGDIGMIEQRERLPLGFEPGDDGLGVGPHLDQLGCDATLDRLTLLREVDRAHAAFAEDT